MEKAWGFHLTPVRIAKVKKTTDSKANKVAGKGGGVSFTVGGIAKPMKPQ